MLKKYQISNHSLLESEDSSHILVYVNPDDAEKNFIIQTMHINEYDIASALDPEEVPRVTFEDDYTTVIWKKARTVLATERPFFNVSSAGIFIKENLLIVVLAEDSPLFDKRHQYKVQSSFDVLLNFLLHTTHHYMGHLRVIKQISNEIEEKIYTSMENEYLIKMFSLSEGLVYYLNAINGNNAVLVKLRNYCEKNDSLRCKTELLDDIMIENSQCLKQAEVYSQILSGLMDARGTIVNNNMNILIKNLTIINVIFLPLNLIAGIGGMSEFSMMTQGVHWWISYSVFMLAIVVVGWLTAIGLYKFGWGSQLKKK
jgi:magnesium transporter